jgi:hypothetical protein
VAQTASTLEETRLTNPLPRSARRPILDLDSARLEILSNRISTSEITLLARSFTLRKKTLDFRRIVIDLTVGNDVENTVDPRERRTCSLESGNIVPAAIQLSVRSANEREQRPHRKRRIEIIEQRRRRIVLELLRGLRQLRGSTLRRSETISEITNAANSLDCSLESFC